MQVTQAAAEWLRGATHRRSRRSTWSPLRLLQGVLAAVLQGARVARITPTTAGKLRAVYIALVFMTRRKLERPGRSRVVTLEKDGRRFNLAIEGPGDLHAIEEVLVEEEYAWPELDEPRVILDLGSHIGTSVIYFALRYPAARIHGVEPDPINFAKLAKNVRPFHRVGVTHAAAGGTNGESTLTTTGTSLGSSLTTNAGAAGIAVRTATLERLLSELGIEQVDLLKVDIEGAEYGLLSRGEGLDRIQAIVGELHPHLIEGSESQFFSLLSDFNLEIEPLSPHWWRFRGKRRAS